MTILKKHLEFETTFETFIVDEQIGQGGAGIVYGGRSRDDTAIAVKVLLSPSTDKRARFKNEIGFLQTNRHSNLVPIIDHGVKQNGKTTSLFYVMPRYEGNLRTLMQRRIAPDDVLPLFTQMLDGVEAA